MISKEITCRLLEATIKIFITTDNDDRVGINFFDSLEETIKNEVKKEQDKRIQDSYDNCF